MSVEELRRAEVLGRVASGELQLVDAAAILGVSYRQAKRLWRRYSDCGAAGLQHGNVGRRSNRAKPKSFRAQVLNRVRKKYSGAVGERFGPTLAAEHLSSEDGLEVSAETLRRWMLSEGLWSRERKRKQHRQRREARAHFGELVQMDGSFHRWYEDRGPQGCLMNMVDDATGTTLARLGDQETIWAAVGVLRQWIRSYGVPCALYTDWKNVYVREATSAEQLRGEVPLTQFGRMCSKLGIRIIAAGSPQAKGRVERNHGTHQDRLVKKLRRKRISTHVEANQYLEMEYLPEHNQRFSHAAMSDEDYHRKTPSKAELREAFRLETERGISNDWVVRYKGQYLQLKPPNRYRGSIRGKATVCEWEDGTLEVLHQGERMPFEFLTTRSEPRVQKKADVVGKNTVIRNRVKPAADHPWRRGLELSGSWVPTPPPFAMRPSASP
jgi:transposase